MRKCAGCGCDLADDGHGVFTVECRECDEQGCEECDGNGEVKVCGDCVVTW